MNHSGLNDNYGHSNGTNGIDNHGSASQNQLSDGVDTEFALRDFLDILLKGKWSILSCFSIVFIAVAFYTFMQAPEYESRSVILVEQTKGGSKSLEDMLLGSADRKVFNEVEILKSHRLARQVAKRIMDEQFSANSEQSLSILGDVNGQPATVDDVAARLVNGYIDVSPISSDVDMIGIKGTSTDPAEATLIADVYAREYLIANIEKSRLKASKTKSILERSVGGLETDIGRIETEVEQFQSIQGALTSEAEVAQLTISISTVQAQRDVAEVDLAEARSSLGSLENQLATAQPGVQARMNSSVDRRIEMTKERLFQIEGEIDNYYSKNPGLRGNESADGKLSLLIRQQVAYQNDLEKYNAQLLSEVEAAGGIDVSAAGAGNPLALVSSLRGQIDRAKIAVSAKTRALNVLERRLGQYQAKLRRIPAKSITQARLDRELTSQSGVYGTIAEKLTEAKVAEESEIGYVSIVDDAVEPKVPVRPNVPLNLILGSLFGLVLGMCIVFLRNAMDHRIRKPEDVKKAGISVVGIVPDMSRVIKEDFEGKSRISGDGRSYSTSLIALLNPLSPVSETYRRLRTNIQFSRPDEKIQVIMITSSGPGEGKTVTATNLAITMAQAGRPTLYIDSDLRRPTGHKMLGLNREPGLVELLFDREVFDRDKYSTGIDDLYAIPAGSSVPNPAELMGSRKMRDLIQRFRGEFDYIIIDTPPVLAVTDSVLLSTHSDASVVVISANETDLHSLERTVQSLQAVDAPLVGAVLNRFDVKKAYGYYGYRYSYGYGYGYGSRYGYDYYGESSRGSKAKQLEKDEVA